MEDHHASPLYARCLHAITEFPFRVATPPVPTGACGAPHRHPTSIPRVPSSRETLRDQSSTTTSNNPRSIPHGLNNPEGCLCLIIIPASRFTEGCPPFSKSALARPIPTRLNRHRHHFHRPTY
ncbi:hypothetical protein BGW36DRAFT_205717 [Talaromyces proteolyticus]|uniref:Uncharacterized protein n=1 Tax=Talaromyces proteolyticus TaxID=1131652 RepID=A0AAD4KNQ7_9EURO|nr:uncharacterized protein BGW36DRAFT_205717 [Talaromyces proteolyticus]KAH8695677.1 hypothetical protein BGW36DRAFT_205717 [Talaromyces proteolyticus]